MKDLIIFKIDKVMKFINKKSKKGSYIMEAAIVLPAIILTTITITLILMFFYNQMTERCRLHVALRQESGYISGHTDYISESDETDAALHTEKTVKGTTVYGKKYLVMEHKGILDKKGTFIVDGGCYVCDGTKYIRYRKILDGDAGGGDR